MLSRLHPVSATVLRIVRTNAAAFGPDFCWPRDQAENSLFVPARERGLSVHKNYGPVILLITIIGFVYEQSYRPNGGGEGGRANT